MGYSFGNALPILAAAWIMASCQTASQKAAAPTPEPEQVVGDAVKDLYMHVSMAPRQSREQQTLILRMAQRASNAKELFLVMRASAGVFPAGDSPAGQEVQRQVQSTVTGKMLKWATLSQLIDYATAYPADGGDGRVLIERIFELGKDTTDARVWHRIRAAAFHLRINDLERQAQVRADALSFQ